MTAPDPEEVMGEHANPYPVRCPLRHCEWSFTVPNAQTPTRAQSDDYGRHLAEHRERLQELFVVADNYR